MKGSVFMRSRYRGVLVALVAVLVLGAVGSASASASSWWVAGSELGSSEPLASTTAKVAEVTLSWSTLKIQCASVGLKGADIVAHTGGSIEHLVLQECTVNSSSCRVVGGKIESKPLKLEAKLGSKSPEDELVAKPASGSVLAEFEFENERCPLEGKQTLGGRLSFVLPKGREEGVEQELVLHESIAGELHMGELPLTSEGAFKAKLVSGRDWSFH
jgi:hypothetical protein